MRILGFDLMSSNYTASALPRIWSHLSTVASAGMREEWTHVCTFSRVLTNAQRSLPSGFLSLCSLSGIKPAWVLEIGRCIHWVSHSGGFFFVFFFCWEWSLKNKLEFNIAAPQGLPQTKTHLSNPPRFGFSPVFNLVSSVLHPFSRIQK